MLSTRFLGFRLEVHATFLILGIFVIDLGWEAALLWLAAAFLSVLVHELGHAWTARRFGGTVDRITIYGMGGLTTWYASWMDKSLARRFLVSAAGSGVEILAGLAVFAAARWGWLGSAVQLIVDTPLRIYTGDALRLGWWAAFFVGSFIWICVVWGLVNWLPIGGLDGSHMLGIVLEKFLPSRGRYHAAIIGLLVAGMAAFWLYRKGFTFAPIILALFSIREFTEASAARK